MYLSSPLLLLIIAIALSSRFCRVSNELNGIVGFKLSSFFILSTSFINLFLANSKNLDLLVSFVIIDTDASSAPFDLKVASTTSPINESSDSTTTAESVSSRASSSLLSVLSIPRLSSSSATLVISGV